MGYYSFKKSINDQKDNIRDIVIPFNILYENKSDINSGQAVVVFLGNNFRDLPGINFEEAMRLTNRSLDYVRRECKDLDLIYKPHPAEADEFNFLDLSGFKIEKGSVAELFYLKNIRKIKYIFSACSSGSMIAYNMGLDSHSFVNIISTSFDQKVMLGYRSHFKNMPPEFFINSFDQPLRESKKKLSDNGILELLIRDVFLKKSGQTWVLLGDPSVLIDVVPIVSLIKKIYPQRIVNLIIEKHHRWNSIPTDDLRQYCDNIFFVPRVFYSLRLKKILNAIKTALLIKRFPIEPDDIILEIFGLGFAANCFTSYFKKSTRVAILSRDVFNISCEEQKFSDSIFRTRLGATFFNLILEPVLGIERTQWLEDKRRVSNVDRYRYPMNDIVDYIWLF